MSTAVIWSKSKPDVEFQYGGRFGKFHGMSSQSHVSHCRVLPLGEFTVVIPEPHATLQGVIILSAILKIVFRHILFIFLFLMQFELWRAADFLSSPVHLYRYRQVLGMCQDFSARWLAGGGGPGTGFTPDFCISVGYLKKLWTDYDEILCVEDYWKTRPWICMKCCVSTDVGTWTNSLIFEPDPD